MNLVPTDLPEVLIIEPLVFGDGRGFFAETWNQARFASAGLDVAFVQDNHSRSARGVLRGIHYQLTQPQGKLVRVVSGSVFDVAVDLRQSSPNFGRWTGVELTADSQRMLWIPPGFGHGFLTLADGTDFLYKCTAFYAPQDEQCVAWNDPDLAIEWPLEGIELVLSDKDRQGIPFAEARVYP
jgi:dTDP-4-dehydrorhamnose 3,5-epimerase